MLKGKYHEVVNGREYVAVSETHTRVSLTETEIYRIFILMKIVLKHGISEYFQRVI